MSLTLVPPLVHQTDRPDTDDENPSGAGSVDYEKLAKNLWHLCADGLQFSQMNAGAILESVLDPLTKCLTPEAARVIVDFKADEKTQGRVDELAALARSGSITSEQRQEYRELVDAFDLVALLQSKARSILAGGG